MESLRIGERAAVAALASVVLFLVPPGAAAAGLLGAAPPLAPFSNATTVVLVAGANNPPEAVDDTLETSLDTLGSVNVLANDSDPDGDTLTVAGHGAAAHGSVACGATGVCSYTPAAGYLGPDSFTYTAADGNGGTATATVQVTVVGVPNNPPSPETDALVTLVNTPGTVDVLANDTDLNGDPLSVAGFGQGSNGAVACTSAGLCTYTPNTDFTGSDTFAYSVDDGASTATGFVFVTVKASNTPPDAVDDILTAHTGAPAALDVLANDTDPDGDALHVVSATAPVHGTVACAPSGRCTYTPTPLYTGPDSFSYTAGDGLESDTATVTVTVTPNQPPAASDDVASTKHDRPVEVSVLANDADPDGDQLSVSDHTGAAHGTVECTPVSCTYTPAAGYLGPDSFGYTASDGQATSSAVVDVTVRANAAPVALDDTLTAVTGVPTDASPTGNDNDVDGDPLTIVGHTDPAHGSATCGASTCMYTSAAGFVGVDGFDYTIGDGEASATGHVAVTVQRPCFPGACIDNGTVLLAVLPEGHLNVENGVGSKAGARPVGLHFLPTHNDATAPGCLCEGWGAADAGTGVTGYANVSTDGVQGITLESFTFTDSTAVSVVTIGGTLRVTQDYHPSAKTPELYEDTVTIENVSGQDLSDIRYRRVMDWDVEPTAFSEFVTIDAGNASELLFDGDNGFLTANPLGARTPILASGSFVDSGPADHGALFDFGFGALATGKSKTFNIFYGAAETEAAAKAAVNAVGAEVFSFGQPSTPDGPTLGTPNTFIFAFGNVGGTAIFTPNAVDDALTTNVGTPGTVDVLANDTDPNGDALTVASFTQGAHGTVACADAGMCTYTPAPGFEGTDAFTYTISDGHGGTDTAAVAVSVVQPNAAPTCVAPSFATLQDTPLDAQVSCADADGDALTYALVAGAAHGSVTVAADGRFTYTPAAGYAGPDSFDFRASDGRVDSATMTASITVTPANHVPHADDTDVATDQDAPVAVTLHATDADGDVLTYAIGTAPAHGSLSGDGASRTYTPDAGYSGADSFTFTASDATSTSNVATVSITVTHRNHPPHAQDATLATDEDTPVGVDLQAGDADGDPLGYTILSGPAHGTLLGAGATRTYLPDENYNGPDSLTFTASDGTLDSNVATVSFVVRPVNDRPVCADLALTVDHASPGDVAPSCSDVDGDPLAITLDSQATKGVASIVGGKLHYEPGATAVGADSFGYVAFDGNVESAPAAVAVTIRPASTPQNDPPVCIDSTASTTTTTPLNGSVHCTDADHDPLVYALVATAGHGTLTFDPDGTFRYVAADGYTGPESLAYTASDGRGGVADATVTITVVPTQDAAPPTCRFAYAGSNADGKRVVDAILRDRASGLASIRVTRAVNATVQLPTFAVGTRSRIVVHTIEIDSGKPNNVELEVKDVAGNTTICDPIVTTLTRPSKLRAGARSVQQTFVGVPNAESKLRLWNGRPGLTRVDVIVNGRQFMLGGLRPGARRFVDLARAMRPGRANTIVLRPHGPRGARATVFVADR